MNKASSHAGLSSIVRTIGRVFGRAPVAAVWVGVFMALVIARVPGLCVGSAMAQPGMTTPEELKGVDIVERLGELAALDVPLMNERGQMVRLSDYFGDGPLARSPEGRGKPAILQLVYYDCPIVCPLTMERMRLAINKIDYTIGRDFNLIVVSIDHTNTTEMALKEKLASVYSYNRGDAPEIAAGWSYHTATAGNAQRLSDSVGFKYTFIPEAGEYAHAPAIMILTPEGRVARYFYGVDYDAKASDLQLALVEASKGEISATLMDRLILFCFHYDPTKGSYTLQAMRVMQIGGVLSMLGIAGLVWVLRLQEKARVRRRASQGAGREAAPTPAGVAPGPTASPAACSPDGTDGGSRGPRQSAVPARPSRPLSRPSVPRTHRSSQAGA